MKVSGALQDYQDSTQKLKDRFNGDYSASAEVATVLKQSSAINTFMLSQPSSMKGRSEWDRQVMIVKRLADAYATTFPFPEGATARRMNDKETAATANALANSANAFKSDLDKATTLPEARQGRSQEGRRVVDQTGQHGEVAHQRWPAGER